MNNLEYLMIHCTATPEGRVVTAAMIKEWHTAKPPRGNGWQKVGYSDLILLNGNLVNLHPYNGDDKKDSFEITNGARGWNGKTHHVVYAGGQTHDGLHAKDTRTTAQHLALRNYIFQAITLWPNIKVLGHNQVNKAKDFCPGFDVPFWLRAIGVPCLNIEENNSWG